ncbi:prion-inhibition and propagation-domain-containing protein [Tuber indicum]|nr:prion-inhibition and propagation-domain-containing protein [Tuber indicum]
MDIAALSIQVFQLYILCVDGYTVFSRAQALGPDSKLVQTKFRIEEHRLEEWGQYWGFNGRDTTQLERSLLMRGKNTRTIVIETLTAISVILRDSDTLMTRYGLKRNDLDSEEFRRGLGGGLAERLTFERGQHDEYVVRINRRNSLLAKCLWGIRDRSRIERLIIELKGFNDTLELLLPRGGEKSIDWSTATLVSGSDDPEELGIVAKALNDLGQEEAGRIVQFRRENILLDRAAAQVLTFRPSQHLLISRNDLDFIPRRGSRERSLALYGADMVMVEWKPYPLDVSGRQIEVISQRADNLARQLHESTGRPANWNILPCLGYFDDAAKFRYGYVNVLPKGIQQYLPLSLYELLETSTPSLGERFRLAEYLAKSLLLFHSSGWVHKSIRSSNIVFFHCAVNNVPLYGNPYIVGFDYARPDNPNAQSVERSTGNNTENAIYRHPDLQRANPRRFTASDDIFGLGLVLLEIGLWKRLRAFGPGQGREFLDRCITETHKLKPKVGIMYANVVKLCLSGDLGSKHEASLGWEKAAGDARWEDDWRKEKLAEGTRFYWEVVHQLGKCQA